MVLTRKKEVKAAVESCSDSVSTHLVYMSKVGLPLVEVFGQPQAVRNFCGIFFCAGSFSKIVMKRRDFLVSAIFASNHAMFVYLNFERSFLNSSENR